MSQSTTTVKSTRDGKIIIKMRDGDIEAPRGMTKSEVLSLIEPYSVGSRNRTQNIRNAVSKAKQQLIKEASRVS